MSCAEGPRAGVLARLRAVLPNTRSLSWRLALWSAASSMLAVLAVSVVMYFAMVAQIRSIDEQVLAKRALRVADVMQSAGVAEAWLGHEVSEDNEGPRQVFMRVVDLGGAILAETPSMSERAAMRLFPQPIPAAAARRLRAVSFGTPEGRIFRALSVRIPARALGPQGEAVVQAAVDTSLDEALLARYRTALAVMFVVAIVLCAAAGAAVAANMLRPLRRMAKQAETIDAGAWGRRLSVAGGAGDELADVGRAFNGVLERLERANAGLKHYADDVAHEIRTPLNRMLMNAEIALREPRSETEYRETIETHIQECSALSRLAERLLFIARAENGRVSPERADLDLRREFEVLQGFYAIAAEEAGLSLRMEVADGDPTVFADRTLFQQAIGNLVSNAIEHTPAGGLVHVTARRTEGGTEITVSDTGAGIPERDLQAVFDRFYRADAARGGGHVGLGLAIVKSIVELHGGKAAIESRAGEFTTVSLWWPDKSGR